MLTMTFPQSMRRAFSWCGREVKLEPTEHRLFEALLLNRGRVMRKDQLALIVWPGEDVPPLWADNILSLYKMRINRKAGYPIIPKPRGRVGEMFIPREFPDV